MMMEDSRDLDALVAEEVMGWRLVKRGRSVVTGTDYRHPGVKYVGGFGGNSDARRWIAVMCPAYSTDMNAAWSVVQKLEAEGFSVRYQTEGRLGVGPRVTVECRAESGAIYGAAESATAARAICKAAIAAMDDMAQKHSEEK